MFAFCFMFLTITHKVSRVRGPGTHCRYSIWWHTGSTPPPSWNKSWVAPEEYLSTSHCGNALHVLNHTILWHGASHSQLEGESWLSIIALFPAQSLSLQLRCSSNYTPPILPSRSLSGTIHAKFSDCMVFTYWVKKGAHDFLLYTCKYVLSTFLPQLIANMFCLR